MFRVTRVLRADVVASAKNAIQKNASTGKDGSFMQKGAKRDPELYVRPSITTTSRFQELY